MSDRIYAAIDLKSFYASCECADMGLDPLTTNLVVADSSRTSKTICLAVSPALKSFGIPGRPRLFEVEERVRQVNAERLAKAPGHTFAGAFTDIRDMDDPAKKLDYIVAPPRMARYMDYSSRIYGIYLKHVAPEDIFAYSVDEVFIDLTAYQSVYNISAHELTMRMIREVLHETGITATAGIGTNLFLAKVAMDVVAKHAAADADGVRIAELDERSFREKLWGHEPITDIWRVGRGTAKRLAPYGVTTMGDIARLSASGEQGMELLYRLFGVNAELLIDHAWGIEPCTIADVKKYHPENNSIGHSQVLSRPYAFDEARIIAREMIDVLSLELVERGVVCESVELILNYDAENLKDPARAKAYQGEIVDDFYGRKAPKPVHGAEKFPEFTNSTSEMLDAVTAIFERIADPSLTIRRVTVVTNHVIREEDIPLPERETDGEQMDLFTDYAERDRREEEENRQKVRERSLQHALLDIRKKYGKNAVLRGMNLQEGATGRERNAQVGGHKA